MQVNKTHIPLAKCRVLYLGSAVPLETVQGMEALQAPLRQRYVCSVTKGDVSGIDLWLKAYSSGLMLTPVDDPVASIWFPIQALKVCAAVKCVETPASASSSSTPRFVPVDSAEAAGTKHPPLFASVMRRGKGIKVLECHVFICKSDRSALELVRSLMYAHDNKDGWMDEEDMPDIFLAPLHPTIVPDTNSGSVAPSPTIPTTNTMLKQLPDFSTVTKPQKPLQLVRKENISSATVRQQLVERSNSISTTSSGVSSISERDEQLKSKPAPKTKAPLRQATDTTLKKNTKAVATTSTTKATTTQPAAVPIPVPVPVPMINGGMMPVGPMLPNHLAYPAMANYYTDWNMYGSMPFFEVMGGDPYELGKNGKDKKKNKSNSKNDKAAAAAAVYNARMQDELMMQAYTSYPTAIYPTAPVTGVIGAYPYPTMMPVPMRMDDWWQQAYSTGSMQRDERQQPASRRPAADDWDRHSDLGYYSDDVYRRGSSSRVSEDSYYYRDRYNRSPAEQERYFERTIVKDADLRQRQSAASHRRAAEEAIYAPVNKDRAEPSSSHPREREENGERQNAYYAASSVSSTQRQPRTIQQRPPSERGPTRDSSPQSYVRHIDTGRISHAGTRTSAR